jgi:hypothetical protein
MPTPKNTPANVGYTMTIDALTIRIISAVAIVSVIIIMAVRKSNNYHISFLGE